MFGAIGACKTSRFMHPFAEQILACQADDCYKRPAVLAVERRKTSAKYAKFSMTASGRESSHAATDGELWWCSALEIGTLPEILFFCNEYQSFATVNRAIPPVTRSCSRRCAMCQAKSITIVATQLTRHAGMNEREPIHFRLWMVMRLADHTCIRKHWTVLATQLILIHRSA